MRPFRFAAALAPGTCVPSSLAEWTAFARRVEALGYSTLAVPDHFGHQLSPIVALAAAAQATTSLRLGTLVLGNDYRHPLVLAQELATLDVLSDGRLEAGIGAGWQRDDYRAAGMPYDRGRMRVERLAEAVAILQGLWAEGPLTFGGEHYAIHDHEGLPKPVQKPWPPILIGGGGPRVLSFAARHADIVSVNLDLRAGVRDPSRVGTSGTGVATDEKVRWIRDEAGDRIDVLELATAVYVAELTDDRDAAAKRVGHQFGIPADEAMRMPHALLGTVDQMVEELVRRRERFGFSYVALPADQAEALAPVVSVLAGT